MGMKERERQIIEAYKNAITGLSASSDDYLYLVELQTGVVWFYGGFDERFDLQKGDERDYWTAEEWIQTLHLHDRTLLKQGLNELKEGSRTLHDVDYRVRNRHGGYTWVNCRGSVEKDEDGVPYLLVGRVSESAMHDKMDALTGLFNINRMQEDMARMFSTVKESYLLLLGIDDLKNINIKSGRKMGDDAICFLAQTLCHAVYFRRVFRFSGDVFGILLPNVSREEVEVLFERVGADLAPRFTVSGGAVLCRRNKDCTPQEVRRFCDYGEYALDRAKHAGKNLLVFFDEDDYKKKVSDIELMEELRRSVRDGCRGFSLVYQPQIRTENYQLFGAEALLRYTSDVRGRVFPDEFIPMLEESELICPVGIWVLETALQQCAAWRKWQPDFHVSVNISYIQLKQPDIMDQVLGVLERSGLPGSALTLEVTESMQLQDFHYYNRIFSQWKKAGIVISVDDFGTGYSNLGYLKNLNIDEIKIDRCFVAGIQNSSYNYQLISNMMELASSTQICVCCEGVEEREELQALEELKPDLLQGYFFSKPCSPELFERMMFLEDAEEYREYYRTIAAVREKPFGALLHLRHRRILNALNMGLWFVRVDAAGGRHQMYADETARRIMGIEEKFSAEECFRFWSDRIREDCHDTVHASMSGAAEKPGKTVSMECFWDHPARGEMLIRFTFVCVMDSDGTVCFEGSCRVVEKNANSGFSALAKQNGMSLISYRTITDFFENLSELVYICDMDTYELLYVNKACRENFGISSMDALKNRKCYEVLQGNDEPCTFCTNCLLEEGRFEEWRHYNPLIGKHMLLRDTMQVHGSRRCRIELATDLTAQEQQANALERFRSLELLANEGMAVALKSSDPDGSINTLLEFIGNTLHAERTYLIERNAQGNDDNTYEWVAEGVTPQIQNLQNVPGEVTADWYRSFRAKKNIIIPDVGELKKTDPSLYETLAQQDIHSIVIVPLFENGEPIGYYGVDNPPPQMLEYAFNFLQILGHFMVSALRRRSLVRKLREMSYHDQLTKLENRYAMNEYVAHLRPETTLGVVYCDIVGLKRVNDNEGHDAGDRLILRCSACLREAFGSCRLFRIGGDELLAICENVDENTVENYVEKLRSLMPQYNVVLSVGSEWRRHVGGAFSAMLTNAEQAMYADKARYYESTGMDRRRH